LAYDEGLALRIRDVIGGRPDVTEKKMFGGIAFMAGGHMACGIVGAELMVRVGPDAHNDALARPHARLMDITGRPMKGMVMVGREGIVSEEGLREWVERGLGFAGGLPPKG
jgi:TfoX/Sxy family transcriptional regulator of competence genes